MKDDFAHAWIIPEEANVVLMVPLHNGQQVLAVLQSQLADVDQALLVEGAQNCPSVAGTVGFWACKVEFKHAYPKFGTGRGGTTTAHRQLK